MKNTDPTASRWMTRSQAAEYLGVSLRTLGNLRAHHDLPVTHMIGRVVRFDREALDAWAAARTHIEVDPAPGPARRGGTSRAHRLRPQPQVSRRGGRR